MKAGVAEAGGLELFFAKAAVVLSRVLSLKVCISQAASRQSALVFCCCTPAIAVHAGAVFMLVQVLSHLCHSQATQSPGASDSLS